MVHRAMCQTHERVRLGRYPRGDQFCSNSQAIMKLIKVTILKVVSLNMIIYSGGPSSTSDGWLPCNIVLLMPT